MFIELKGCLQLQSQAFSVQPHAQSNSSFLNCSHVSTIGFSRAKLIKSADCGNTSSAPIILRPRRPDGIRTSHRVFWQWLSSQRKLVLRVQPLYVPLCEWILDQLGLSFLWEGLSLWSDWTQELKTQICSVLLFRSVRVPTPTRTCATLIPAQPGC